MDMMVFFNVAWMEHYKGITANDVPIGGGSFVPGHGYGSEVYNFQPFKGRVYGFVEAGWKPRPRKIRITRLGAHKGDALASPVLVVWIARHPREQRTLVVGWYKYAKVYRQRQPAPQGSNRKLPSGREASYFAEAEASNCRLVPADLRDCKIPRGEGGLGRSNIWYADGPEGAKIKVEVLEYIRTLHRSLPACS